MSCQHRTAGFFSFSIFLLVLVFAQKTSGAERNVVWIGLPKAEWNAQITPINIKTDIPFGSAFLKHLRRQAILLAAREELGAATRDEFLSETAPQDAVKIDHPDRFVVDNSTTGPAEENLFSLDADYPRLVAKLELLSRTEFVAGLEKLGVQKQTATKAGAENSNEIDDVIAKRLRDWATIPQLDAVRRLHESIRNEGETLPKLAALVRGYTQLQMLTNVVLRDTHRVFQTRAILYAQRAVTKFGETDETRRIRAAAWSLNNFHRIARQEFAGIRSNGEDSWTAAARLYADYDIEGLDKFIVTLKGELHESLAKQLKFYLLDYSNNRDMAAEYGRSIIADFPDCGRHYLNVFGFWVHNMPNAPDGSPYFDRLEKRIGTALRGLDDLPAPVSQAQRELQKLFGNAGGGGIVPALLGVPPQVARGNELPKPEYFRALGELLKELNAVKPAEDDGEPSLPALGTLLQDEEFYSALLLTNRLLEQGQDPTTFVQSLKPAFESHPFMDHIGVMCKDVKVRDEFKKAMNGKKISYELFSMAHLGFPVGPNRNTWSENNRIQPYFFGFRWADKENIRDLCYLEQEMLWQFAANVPVYPLPMMERVCPNNPFTVAERIARTGEASEGEAEKLYERFGNYPNFRAAITKFFEQSDKDMKSLGFLRRINKDYPNSRGVLKIAQQYLELNEIDEAVDTLSEYAEKHGRNDYDGGEFNLTVGRILCNEGLLDKASPYFDVDADGGTLRSLPRLTMVSRFKELTGKFEDAEAMLRNAEGAYSSWWATCYRTKSPMLGDATETLYDKVMQQVKKAPRNNRELILVFYALYCMGVPMEEEFGGDPSVNVFFTQNSPFAGFLAFFDALQSKDTVKVGVLLKLLQERGTEIPKADLSHALQAAKLPTGQKNPRIEKPVYRMLAAMFELDQRSPKPGTLNPKDVDRLLRTTYKNVLDSGEYPFVLYLLGRYSVICGDKEKGFDYYRRVFSSRLLDQDFPTCFVVREMIKEHLGETKYRPDKEWTAWVKSDADFPKEKPLSKSDADLFLQELLAKLETGNDEPKEVPETSVESKDVIVRRAAIPLTEVLTPGWQTNISEPQLVRMFGGRQGKIYFTDISPDGKRIVSTGDDHDAVLWDAETATEIAAVKKPKNSRGSAITFTPDAKSVLFGGVAGEVGLWRPTPSDKSKDQAPVWQKTEHPWTGWICVTKDGKHFCSTAESDAKFGVFIWETETGKLLKTLVDHKKLVYAAVYFADGTRLVTASKDGTSLIYDMETGKPIFSLRGHQEDVRCVAVSPDDSLIVTGSLDDTVIVWNAKTGEPIKRFGTFNGDVISVSFSPDGSKIAIGRNWNGEGTFIIDTKTWKLSHFVPGHGFWSCKTSWSADSRFLVTGGDDMRLWKFFGDDDGPAVSLPGDVKELPLSKIPSAVLLAGVHRWEFGKYRSSRKAFENDSLWAHAPCRFVLKLDGTWKTLKTSYGISVGANLGQASCVFVVKADEKEVFRSEMIRDNLDRPLEIDLTGVKRLELFVDANGNNYNDHAVWYEPALSR